MAYTLKTTKKFDRAVQRCIARGYDMLALQTAIMLNLYRGGEKIVDIQLFSERKNN